MVNIDTQKNKNQDVHQKKERISTQCVCCGSENLRSSPAILMPFIARRVFNWAPVIIDESWGLSTIKNGSAYSICNSLSCVDCGFLFLDIRFSDSELSKLYSDYRGESYNALREFYEPGYAVRSDKLNAGIKYVKDIENFLEPHLKFPLRILDWGGDTGKNTPFKKNNEVFDIYGISSKDVIVEAKVVKKEEAFSKKYTLVVCSNVLEHVPYPSEVLLDIFKIMDKDSVLYLETPLEDLVLSNASDLHLKKKHWHEHINFFSEKSLKCLVKSVGFEVVDLKKLQATAGGKSSYLFQVACKLKSS